MFSLHTNNTYKNHRILTTNSFHIIRLYLLGIDIALFIFVVNKQMMPITNCAQTVMNNYIKPNSFSILNSFWI